MADYITGKLENIISGHKINDDDAAWLRALNPQAPAEAHAPGWRKTAETLFAFLESVKDVGCVTQYEDGSDTPNKHLMNRLHGELADLLAAQPQPKAAEGDAATAELVRLANCCPELNLSNYGPDDVDELNAWAIEVAQEIDRFVASHVQPKSTEDQAAHDNAIYERGRQDGINQMRDTLAALAPSPAPGADRPLPAELGEWLTAIGELYIAMGRPPFEATEPTMGVVETLREAAKRVATIEGLQQAVAAGFPVVARWTKNAQDGAPRARVWVQFEDGGPEVEFASGTQAPAVAHGEPVVRLTVRDQSVGTDTLEAAWRLPHGKYDLFAVPVESKPPVQGSGQ